MGGVGDAIDGRDLDYEDGSIDEWTETEETRAEDAVARAAQRAHPWLYKLVRAPRVAAGGVAYALGGGWLPKDWWRFNKWKLFGGKAAKPAAERSSFSLASKPKFTTPGGGERHSASYTPAERRAAGGCASGAGARSSASAPTCSSR